MRLKAAWRQKSHWRQGRTSLGPTSNLEGKRNITVCVKITQNCETLKIDPIFNGQSWSYGKQFISACYVIKMQ